MSTAAAATLDADFSRFQRSRPNQVAGERPAALPFLLVGTTESAGSSGQSPFELLRSDITPEFASAEAIKQKPLERDQAVLLRSWSDHIATALDSLIFAQNALPNQTASGIPLDHVFVANSGSTPWVNFDMTLGRALSVVTAFATVTTPARSVMLIPSVPERISSPLENKIIAERSSAEVDAEHIAIADAAGRDALMLVRGADLKGNPSVLFAHDGILTLQWQRGEHGVALLFAGDGIASIAFRRPGQFYAENGLDAPVDEKLPMSFFDALNLVVA